MSTAQSPARNSASRTRGLWRPKAATIALGAASAVGVVGVTAAVVPALTSTGAAAGTSTAPTGADAVPSHGAGSSTTLPTPAHSKPITVSTGS